MLGVDSIGNEVFLAILNSAYQGIVVIDKFERVVLFNEAAEEIVGIPQSEAHNRHIREIIPNTGLIDVLRTGQVQVGEKVVMNGRTLIAYRAPIRFNSEIWGAVGIFHDISTLEGITGELESYRKMVGDLERIKKELELIVESSNDGLYITDGNGITLRINRTYEEITGIKAHEVVGRHMQELVDAGFFSESVTLHILAQKPPRPVTRIQSLRNGRYVISTGRPVFDQNGNVYRVVTNVRDVTHFRDFERRLEETKAALEKYREEATRLRLEFLKDEDLVGRSKAMLHVVEMAKKVAPYPTTVLVTGESGVGKELVAKLLHRHSGWSDGPFIKVNCGAIPESLIESELFGYEPGAFTGAGKKGKPGMLELADNGTLFLDEIGELALDLQVKLLQVIQDQKVARLGGVSSHTITVRFIAATNRDLTGMVEEKLFRADLYYRLNVVKIEVPPLRERKEDIPTLILHYLSKYCNEYKLNKGISTEAMQLLCAYSWPGNVRELKNVMENLVVMVSDPLILPEHVPVEINSQMQMRQGQVSVLRIIPIKDAVAEVETQLIDRALTECGSIRKAAKVLHIAHSTLLRKMSLLGVRPPSVH